MPQEVSIKCPQTTAQKPHFDGFEKPDCGPIQLNWSHKTPSACFITMMKPLRKSKPAVKTPGGCRAAGSVQKVPPNHSTETPLRRLREARLWPHSTQLESEDTLCMPSCHDEAAAQI